MNSMLTNSLSVQVGSRGPVVNSKKSPTSFPIGKKLSAPITLCSYGITELILLDNFKWPFTMVSSKPTASPPTSFSSSTIFADGLPFPKIIVFDIDYTLWSFWSDTHITPPLKAVKNGSKVQDRYRESFEFYEDVPSILTAVCTDLVLA
jgi:hypothetical protein